MKHCFLLTGANAAGKTTCIEKTLVPWMTPYGPDPRIMNIRADNDGRFKGDAQDQRKALTEVWLSDVPVIVIEGTRINTPLQDVAKANREARSLTVLMALQRPDVMKAHLINRCAKRGKTFRADYWTYNKLAYEGMNRYPNNFRKNGVTPKTYMIDLEYKVCEQIIEDLQIRIGEVLSEQTPSDPKL